MAVKDAVLSTAVDVARSAAQEVAEVPDLVGEHLGVVVEGERLLAHRFASNAPGYRGWTWTVTLARVPRGRTATVCEVDLLPDEEALLAPAWVPWSERLRPGDLGPGDALPYLPDDDRLDPGYAATGAVDDDRVAIDELGLGRARVLSLAGRGEAAERWYTGPHGPTAPVAVAAAQPCSTCGFLVLMAGSMRTVFGVCANEWSPDDGSVVSMDHGCGAHSETDVPQLSTDWPAPPRPGDDLELVPHTVDPEVEPGADVAEPAPERVDPEAEFVEPEPQTDESESAPDPVVTEPVADVTEPEPAPESGPE